MHGSPSFHEILMSPVQMELRHLAWLSFVQNSSGQQFRDAEVVTECVHGDLTRVHVFALKTVKIIQNGLVRSEK